MRTRRSTLIKQETRDKKFVSACPIKLIGPRWVADVSVPRFNCKNFRVYSLEVK
jgi:hypothetical protein